MFVLRIVSSAKYVGGECTRAERGFAFLAVLAGDNWVSEHFDRGLCNYHRMRLHVVFKGMDSPYELLNGICHQDYRFQVSYSMVMERS